MFAVNMLFSPKSIEKSWQIKIVTNYDDKNFNYVFFRRRFLIRTLIHSICLFLIANFARMMFFSKNEFFRSKKFFLLIKLSKITTKELIIKIFMIATYYINTYMLHFSLRMCVRYWALRLMWIIQHFDVQHMNRYRNLISLKNFESEQNSFNLIHIDCEINSLCNIFWHQNIRATFEEHIKSHNSRPTALIERITRSSLLQHLYRLHRFGAQHARRTERGDETRGSEHICGDCGAGAGEVLMFSPSAMLELVEGEAPQKLGMEWLKVRIRSRLTEDGGRTILAT